MNISRDKVREDISLVLKDKEKAIELARKIEKNYLSLYHALNSLEDWKEGNEMMLHARQKDVSFNFCTKKDSSSNKKFFTISRYGYTVSIFDDHIELREASFTVFSKKGSLEEVFTEVYIKHESYHRVEELISLPSAVLEGTKDKHDKLEEERKAGGLDSLLEESSVNIFDLEKMQSAYYNNPELFKKLFNLINEKQKKEVVQAIIKSKEANNAVNKWLEAEHKEITDEAGRDYISEEKWK